MTLERRAVNLRRAERGAGKSLGDDSVPVPLKHASEDTQALRQRDMVALGLLPHEYAELAKGAQVNAQFGGYIDIATVSVK